jgi:Mrp family chromosome partitioning ATPase
LLDSPPMLLSADAEALSALSDLSVLVVRQDYTPAGILNDCADALTQSGTDFAGFILNDFYAAVHPQQLFAVRTASSK